MDVNEALQFADEWTKGHTFYEGMQGWRVVCASVLRNMAAAAEDRDGDK